MSKRKSLAIAGFIKPGFEAVREAFVENFTRRHELGAACCIYYHGEKVVDLWGGIRNKATGEPWEEDTMVVVYSATKGMAMIAIHPWDIFVMSMQEMLDGKGLSPMLMGTPRCEV